MADIDFATVIPKFDAILSRGLCAGIGDRDGQMCIEAAICAALDLPHGDEPTCVHRAIRSFKIRLNDATWSSPEARAQGLRRLGILQMGTDAGFDVTRFVTALSIRTVRELLSDLLEKLDATRYATHIAACRSVTTREEAQVVARAATYAATYATAAAATAATYAATYATAAAAAAVTYAAAAATTATYAAATYAAADARRTRLADLPSDYYLLLSARIAESILTEMQTPGAQWLASVEAV